MKPKSAKAGDINAVKGYDCCQTPAYAIAPLVKHIPKHYTIWEPASGAGFMVAALRAYGYNVVHSDIQGGHNFFDYAPPEYDIIVTNPPYSIKYKWLKRCYELQKPFALLVPVETLGAKSAQVFIKEYGLQAIFLDKRVDFIMPVKGGNSSAQFPVMWLCHEVIEGYCTSLIEFASIDKKGA